MGKHHLYQLQGWFCDVERLFHKLCGIWDRFFLFCFFFFVKKNVEIQIFFLEIFYSSNKFYSDGRCGSDFYFRITETQGIQISINVPNIFLGKPYLKEITLRFLAVVKDFEGFSRALEIYNTTNRYYSYLSRIEFPDVSSRTDQNFCANSNSDSFKYIETTINGIYSSLYFGAAGWASYNFGVNYFIFQVKQTCPTNSLRRKEDPRGCVCKDGFLPIPLDWDCDYSLFGFCFYCKPCPVHCNTCNIQGDCLSCIDGVLSEKACLPVSG